MTGTFSPIPLLPQEEGNTGDKAKRYSHPGQQDARAQMTQRMLKPVGPVKLPFNYAARCAIYSVLLVLSLLGLIFSILPPCAQTYMELIQTVRVVYSNYTYTTTRSVSIMGFTRSFTPSCRGATGDLAGTFYVLGNGFPSDVCVTTPASVRTAGGLTIVALIGSVVLLAFVCVMLGLLSCQRGRTAEHSIAREQQKRYEEFRQTRAQAAADGLPFSVLVRDPGMLAAATIPNLTEAEAYYAREDARDAKTRQILSIASLLLSVICLAVSVAALVCGLQAEPGIRQTARDVQAASNGTIMNTSVLGAMEGISVWPNAANIAVYAIAAVLLAVPYLSGLADRPVPAEKEEEEVLTVLLCVPHPTK